MPATWKPAEPHLNRKRASASWATHAKTSRGDTDGFHSVHEFFCKIKTWKQSFQAAKLGTAHFRKENSISFFSHHGSAGTGKALQLAQLAQLAQSSSRCLLTVTASCSHLLGPGRSQTSRPCWPPCPQELTGRGLLPGRQRRWACCTLKGLI